MLFISKLFLLTFAYFQGFYVPINLVKVTSHHGKVIRGINKCALSKCAISLKFSQYIEKSMYNQVIDFFLRNSGSQSDTSQQQSQSDCCWRVFFGEKLVVQFKQCSPWNWRWNSTHFPTPTSNIFSNKWIVKLWE